MINGARKGRLYVPARLEDNPSLDRSSYEESLRQLGGVVFRQLRYGDWDVKPEGRMFKRAWFDVITEEEWAEVLEDSKVDRVRHWDLAATETPKGTAAKKQNDPDYTVGLLLARDRKSGLYYVEDVQRGRWSPATVESVVEDVATNEDGRGVPIDDGAGTGRVGQVARLALSPARTRRVQLPRPAVDGVEGGPRVDRRGARRARRDRPRRGSVGRGLLGRARRVPEGLHDGQVDGLSGAYESLTGKRSHRTVGDTDRPDRRVLLDRLRRVNALVRGPETYVYPRFDTVPKR